MIDQAAAVVPPSFFCTKPFESVEVHLSGDVFVCCPSWLKKPIGNIHQNRVKDVWNSETAQDIRSSILNGSYKYCDRNECPFLHTGVPALSDLSAQKLASIKETKQVELDYTPLDVMLTYDPSCNLSCPSCRNTKISFPQDSEDYRKSKKITENIYEDFIKDSKDSFLRLNVTGSGDPFASLVFRQFLEDLDGTKLPGLRLDLQTNGLLLTPLMWDRMHKLHGNIDNLFVSIDAATEATYVNVRRGGQWDVIVKNMRFLGELKKQKKIKHLMARFVVQKANYKEMPAFAKLFHELGCTSIYFSRMTDWSTWSTYEFNKQLIFLPSHPEYDAFVEVLAHAELHKHYVNLGNLSTLAKIAIEKKKANAALVERISMQLRFLLQDLIRRRFFLPRKIQNFIKKWTPIFR
jgi:sulfatase maturation enzyme AslB (radical SAM superfamily)